MSCLAPTVFGLPPQGDQGGSYVDLSPSEATALAIPAGAERVQVFNSSSHDLELTWVQAYGGQPATGETPWVTLPAGQSLPVPALVPTPAARSLRLANGPGGLPTPERVWVAWLFRLSSQCE